MAHPKLAATNSDRVISSFLLVWRWSRLFSLPSQAACITGAAITGAFVFWRQVLPWVIRVLPFLNKLRQQQSAQQGQSAIQTGHLSATLDHASGLIEGEIIEGPHKGWLLSELSMSELESLLERYQTSDEESAELLQAYIDQRTQQANEAEEERSEAQREAAADSSRAEALATLGLDRGCDRRRNYRGTPKSHPKTSSDRGGNDFRCEDQSSQRHSC